MDGGITKALGLYHRKAAACEIGITCVIKIVDIFCQWLSYLKIQRFLFIGNVGLALAVSHQLHGVHFIQGQRRILYYQYGIQGYRTAPHFSDNLIACYYKGGIVRRIQRSLHIQSAGYRRSSALELWYYGHFYRLIQLGRPDSPAMGSDHHHIVHHLHLPHSCRAQVVFHKRPGVSVVG